MKLRNKKTGEIKQAEAREDGIYLYDEITEQWYKYELDLLAKGWEYYEEPAYYYFIQDDGQIGCDAVEPLNHKSKLDENKTIGNYFETKEEAEKAVEKLKAWKRLKDKDFQFHGHNALGLGEITFSLDFEDMDDEGEIGQLRHDLDLLFGGEQ